MDRRIRERYCVIGDSGQVSIVTVETSADLSGAAVQREAAFPTTQWSLVLRAGANESELAHVSLEALCRRYWYSLYAFLRRQGNDHHTAEDLTQGFFSLLLESGRLACAAPERGRFRTFLMTSLRNYATSEWRRDHAAKRGGVVPPVPLELPSAAARFAAEPVAQGLGPEEEFDRGWAVDLIQQAIERMHTEYASTGRADLFAGLLPHATGEAADQPQAVAARRLGLNEQAFAVAVSRLRRRLRQCLRAVVAETLASAEDTDDEMRILMDAVRGYTKPR